MANSQLPLNGDWSYTFTDDKANASPATDVSNWKTIESNKMNWEKKDLPAGSGNIIWIRKTVVIPSSLKKELEKTGALMLYLGRIRQKIKCFLMANQPGKQTQAISKELML
jgi:hypothetical protein